ncbi:Ig-like domain-containing protein [Streptomyces sp. NBC_00057]
MNHVAKRVVASSVTVLTWAGLLAVPAVVSGCTDAGSIFSGKARSPQEAILITPLDGAKNIGPDGRTEVKVPDGRLEGVKVTRIEDARRQEVPGRIAHDGLSWTPREKTGRLGLASEYSVDAVALDGAGNRSARHTAFTTAVPEHRFWQQRHPGRPVLRPDTHRRCDRGRQLQGQAGGTGQRARRPECEPDPVEGRLGPPLRPRRIPQGLSGGSGHGQAGRPRRTRTACHLVKSRDKLRLNGDIRGVIFPGSV